MIESTESEQEWEPRLAELLERLSGTQGELLALLNKKRQLLLARDHQGLAELATEEQRLCDELQSCHTARQQLLSQAANDGLPADSIQSLAAALPGEQSKALEKPLSESQQRARVLQHQSLTQWVVVQRSLLHLSQMVEIIACGGRPQPTYGKGGTAAKSGALMDQAI